MSEVANGAKTVVKSKTVWLNVILCVLAVVCLLQDSVIVPATAMPYLVLIAAILNIVMRAFTNQGVKIK